MNIVLIPYPESLNTFSHCFLYGPSFYGLDIVVSEDNRTMFSEEALKAYKKVNAKERLRVPKCISLVEFERILTL